MTTAKCQVIMRLLIIVSLAAVTYAADHAKKFERNENVMRNNICGISPPTCRSCRYRSLDGSCNNLKHPSWGTPFSPYGRLAKNSYSDGIHALPQSVTKEPLINPRLLSLLVSPDVVQKDKIWTVLVLQFGQIIAHEMSFTFDIPQTGGDDITCCTNGEPIPPKSSLNPKCAPIPFTSRDNYNDPEGNTCIDFVRTSTNKDKKCLIPGKVEEPLTSVTSYIDLSVLYGSSIMQADLVRSFNNGKLASKKRNGEEWLPQDPNPTACNVKSPQEPCYFAGDERVNQNPQLAIIQTMLMREHNRIAEKLCVLINPHWSDERCFQETRKILIAKYQHITYTEFLPIFLGLNIMIEEGLLNPNAKGFVHDYDPKVNAQILNEQATAAFRALHSLIVGKLRVYSESRELIDVIRLSDWFNRPSIIEKYPSGLARGLCTQAQNANDRFYDDEISQYFFRPENELLGSDLHAIDLQRSRDHGVATYATMLEKCGLGRPKSFRDLKNIKPDYIRLIERAYKKVDDIELPIGGLLERKVNGTLSGPTFLCVMLEQFKRSRFGDRFFYENGNSFTIDQLNSIRKTTIARMFCDNFKDIKSMQPMAFRIISETNALQPCNTLPQEDLFLWKEYPQEYLGKPEIKC